MLELISENKQFGGWHRRYRHDSDCNQCSMQLAVFFPDNIRLDKDTPVLYYLSGLSCTDENVMQKSGIQRAANEHQLLIVAPDTSPRGAEVADAEGYDLGQGAGFYVNATQAPWATHYQMYDYIVSELPTLIKAAFGVGDNCSITGHSMGGHGALQIGLKNPDQYRSISAFSPITQPSQCPWGQKAFTAYLGDDQKAWLEYDSCDLLVKQDNHLPILVDQGSADPFLDEQLKPDCFLAAVATANAHIEYHLRDGYDHSYFYISSFIDHHLAFHAKYLHAQVSA